MGDFSCHIHGNISKFIECPFCPYDQMIERLADQLETAHQCRMDDDIREECEKTVAIARAFLKGCRSETQT